MRFQCPACKKIVSVENGDMGTTVECGHCGQQVTVPSSRVSSGSLIGDFIILHEIGRGGMGIVYLAHQISLDRPAALKILAENYASNSEFVVGFIKEARAAAKLNHPNIVQAYAVGDDEGIFYFAMEHVDGETMKDILKKRKIIPAKEACGIIQQVAEALDYAWKEEKLVHRDIKPDNIMLTASGRAKLADLGLAKVGDDIEGNDSDEVMGTPQYISPEQLTGDLLDNRTDIYSLGATFYHFLTGRFPYEGANALEISQQHLSGTLIPPCQINPDIPPDVSRVVEKMMAKDPKFRYQDAGLLAEDLSLIKRGIQPEVATASAALKVLHSNKQEAGSRTVPPKLQLRGIGQKGPTPPQNQGTETVVEAPLNKPQASPKLVLNKPASAPSVSLPKKPVLSVPKPVGKESSSAAKNVPAPAVPKPPAAPAPAVSKESAAPQIPAKEPAEKKKKTAPVSRWKWGLMVVILLILLIAGGGFCYIHFVKKTTITDFMKNFKSMKIAGVSTPAEKKAAPETSFMKSASEVLALIRTKENMDETAALKKCEDFIKANIPPANPEEQKILQEIKDAQLKLDQKRQEALRQKEIAARKAKEEQAKKALAEAQKRQAEAAKQKREAEARAKAAKAAAAKKQQEEKRYKAKIQTMQWNAVVDIVRFSRRNKDIAGLQASWKRYESERKKAPANYVRFVNPLNATINRLRNQMGKAWKWDQLLKDGDSRLTGLKVEIGIHYCSLISLKNNVIQGSSPNKKIYSAKITQRSMHQHKMMKFMINAGGMVGMVDSLPFYFFWLGEYDLAEKAKDHISARGRNEYSTFLVEYLQAARRCGGNDWKWAQQFKNMPEFKRVK